MPVRDRAAQLDRALTPLGLICLVVDDASRNRAAIARVCGRHGATYLPIYHNVGPAAARDFGLARVQTPYVAFVDSDVQVTINDLLHLARHFTDPHVALVGPRILGRPTSSRPRWFERYDAVASSLTLGHTPSNVQPGAIVAWLPSACLIARTHALGDGFDPTLRVGEDVDLVWRLVAADHTVRYDPSVTAHHDTRSTVRAWLGRKFAYGTGGAPLAARHGSLVAPAILTPTQAAAATALLLRRRWSLLVAAATLAWTAARVRSTLPDVPGRGALGTRIAGRGLGWAVRQESALAVRHWWPAAAAAAGLSRQARRALLTAALVDSAVALRDSRAGGATVNPLLLLAGRRLDDLAYGAGLWWGAMQRLSPRAMMPRMPRALGTRRRPDNARALPAGQARLSETERVRHG